MSQQYPGDTATITTPAGDASTAKYEEARAAASRAISTISIPQETPLRTPPAPEAEAEVDPELLSYRGFKFGAAFFGYLIAISMSVLLLAAVAAAAFGTAEILDYTTGDAKTQPGAALLTAAGVTVFMLAVAFYTGGYVAGRLARFDGGRQGFGVWMIALLVSLVAGGAGWFVDNQYAVVDDINRPDVSLADNTLLLGSIGAAAALLLLTLLAAIVGGKSGRRYHDRIDELL
ncbi:hypothetical protein [Kribbella sp. HUAS MG21]|uniref:Major facilitator superfamily (MFS) profile domain-containing protein n=1 Tax=Kribbella sp. HUAS MG21 TaxID=3160966 RepID=A0AAU7T433_9ACTN